MTSDPPLRLSDAFIVAKTVTYVSSLPVTYVTTLYTLLARAFCLQNAVPQAQMRLFSFGKSGNGIFPAGGAMPRPYRMTKLVAGATE
jgi:hypothetical protein